MVRVRGSYGWPPGRTSPNLHALNECCLDELEDAEILESFRYRPRDIQNASECYNRLPKDRKYTVSCIIRYQRTPSWCMKTSDRVYDRWRKHLMVNDFWHFKKNGSFTKYRQLTEDCSD